MCVQPSLRARTPRSLTSTLLASTPCFHAMVCPDQDKAAELDVKEYSLSQISLEQIFNGFAAQQEEEQGVAAGIL